MHATVEGYCGREHKHSSLKIHRTRKRCMWRRCGETEQRPVDSLFGWLAAASDTIVSCKSVRSHKHHCHCYICGRENKNQRQNRRNAEVQMIRSWPKFIIRLVFEQRGWRRRLCTWTWSILSIQPVCGQPDRCRNRICHFGCPLITRNLRCIRQPIFD